MRVPHTGGPRSLNTLSIPALRVPSSAACGWSLTCQMSSWENRPGVAGWSGARGCGAMRSARDLHFVGRDGVASGAGVACDIRSGACEFSHESVDTCGWSHCIAVTVQEDEASRSEISGNG